ncbi:MAG: hypothetical protein LBQ66_14015 [Planctomycetaceae bacterium]|nr:hypothetical protein [Planctomycetaceae bacterium]
MCGTTRAGCPRSSPRRCAAIREANMIEESVPSNFLQGTVFTILDF